MFLNFHFSFQDVYLVLCKFNWINIEERTSNTINCFIQLRLMSFRLVVKLAISDDDCFLLLSRSTCDWILCQPFGRSLNSLVLMVKAHSGLCNFWSFSLPWNCLSQWNRFLWSGVADVHAAKTPSKCFICSTCKFFKIIFCFQNYFFTYLKEQLALYFVFQFLFQRG